MKYQIEIDWQWDFILKKAIVNEMRRLWKESVWIAPKIKTDDHYWGNNIDQLADILIQITNQA